MFVTPVCFLAAKAPCSVNTGAWCGVHTIYNRSRHTHDELRSGKKGKQANSRPSGEGTKLIYGTMTLAASVNDEQAKEQLERFFTRRAELGDAKIELDTASLYEDGKTELLLGRVLTDEQRAKMYIATKANPWSSKGLSPESVKSQLNKSLQSMGLSSVDLFYLHAPDPKTPIEDTLKAVQELYEEGKFKELVSYSGLSNYAAWQVADIVHICRKNNYVVPTVYQGMYNALTRDVERELFPCLRRFGIRFYAYNPLAGGLLTSRYANHAEKPKDGRFVERPHYVDRFWKKSYFDALEVVRAALQKLAEEGGDAPQIDIAEASLTWLRHHSQLKGYLGDGIIIGQSSMAHLESNMRGFERETPLPKPIVTAFDMAWKTCKPDCPQYAR